MSLPGNSDSEKGDDDVAIIGMACLFPKAPTLRDYWQNIVAGRSAISDPPADWDADRYYARAATGNDLTYCKRGGYLGDLARFDPLEFGIMPSSVDGGEPDQFLALKVAKEALYDAGYTEKSLDPERTEVIVGRGTYINRGVTNSFQHTVVVEQTLDILKSVLPELRGDDLRDIKERLKKTLPPFNAETVPSLVPNVLAGRIANRLNIMGTNYLVDAACASSLIAVEHGLSDLRSGKADLALVGGVNASIPPTMLIIFSQITALSRQEQLQPFGESADGTMLGEGVGFVVLKRKRDAVRDGNRIYAMIKSVGVASDGRALGPLSPRVEGEALAIRRAYEGAGVHPGTVELIEAHGTATPVGDLAEIESLRRVFGDGQGKRPHCALGTVKSMIGHLIPASGMAGLIKTALALHHKVLPPTLCAKPSSRLGLERTPFFINTETRPWIHADRQYPRRAGVNAFGFGGINAHAILEEHAADPRIPFENFLHDWETEVFLFQGKTREALLAEMADIDNLLQSRPDANLKDLAFTLNGRDINGAYRLAIVAASGAELREKIGGACRRLQDPACRRIRTKSGIYFFQEPLGQEGKVAFLFPGEGAQYPSMLADLCLHFPEVRGVFDLADRAFVDHERGYLPSHTVFPLPAGQKRDADRLWAMDSAAESVFSANMALLRVMQGLEIKPDVLLGHSTGEYSSILAGGMVDVEQEEQFTNFVRGVNKVYENVAANGQIAPGILLSIGAADAQSVKETVARLDASLFIAMENCPQQTIVCGDEQAIARAEEIFRGQGAILERLPFQRAYHTPLFQPICDSLLEFFQSLEVGPPKVRTYSCITAAPYPEEADAIRELATSQWARKVCFTDSVKALHAEGVRIFVEVGPRGNLVSFVDNILQKEPYLAVAANMQRRSGITQLNHLVGLLAAHHVPLQPAFLYQYRKPQKLALTPADSGSAPPPVARTAVAINLTLPRLRLENYALQGPRPTSAGKAACPGPAAPPGVTGPPAGNRSRVMTAYLKNMERFLDSQQTLLQSYMAVKKGRAAASSDGQPGAAGSPGKGSREAAPPFIREISTYLPGRELQARCRLKVDEDVFLRDHTLGAKVSQVDAGLLALPVVPLTFSMEIMAEAACLLLEGKKLVGMREVRAYRWLGLDSGEKLLRITAKVAPDRPEEVKVLIYDEDDEREKTGPPQPAIPVVEGVMLFAAGYPPAEEAGAFPLVRQRKSKWNGKELYGGFMFHGPRLQGVSTMESWGENGATATLKAMPAADCFTFAGHPDFVTDPIMLDAAGQVIAYWTSDHLEQAFHIFPFRLESLLLYGESLPAGAAAVCRAKIELVENLQVRSDIDIIGPDGKVRMRLQGWWDRRFDKPDKFYRLRMQPKNAMLGDLWQGGAAAGIDKGMTLCMLSGLPKDFLTAHNRIWMRVLAHLVLSRRERQYWYGMPATEARRLEWLLGRVAIKDCIRYHLRENGRGDVYPADIEIAVDDNGRPFIAAIAGDRNATGFPISISHSADVTCAAVGSGDKKGVGIDVEQYRALADDFGKLAFTETELGILARGNDAERQEWALRLWCAKEAAVKKSGLGLAGNPRNFRVSAVNRDTGEVEVVIAGENPHDNVQVKTLRQGDYVLAIAS